MHGRLTVFQGEPAQVDEATRVLRERVLPGARELGGFKGVISLADRTTGKGLTITLWESEEAMRASEEAANSLRADAMSALGAGTPTVERYEVTLFEV